jgi:LDH2 family malate/lactate/ureidoglycolate dehydrogenase
MSTELGGLRFTDRPFRVSQFFLALDISRFMPPAEFETRLRKLVAMAKSARPAPDYYEVLVAGEPEWRAESEYRESGVPLTEGVWEELRTRAEKLGIPTPPALSTD